MAKKYLDEDGLKKYTELIKGKVNSTAEGLQASINLKADEATVNSALSSKVNTTEYTKEVENIYGKINEVNALASNLKLSFTATSAIEQNVSSSVKLTATITGNFELNDVKSITITRGETSFTLSDPKAVTGGYEYTTSETVTLAAGASYKYTCNANVKGLDLPEVEKSTTAYYKTYYAATNDIITVTEWDGDAPISGVLNTNALSNINFADLGGVKSVVASSAARTYDCGQVSANENGAKFVLFVPTGVTKPNAANFKDSNTSFGATMDVIENQMIGGVSYTIYYTAGAAIYPAGTTLKIVAGS